MTKYTPFEDIDRMFDQMRHSLWSPESEFVRGFGRMRRDVHINLTKRDDEFVLMADLPGFERDEIGLRFADGALFISAEHEVEGGEYAESRHVQERVTLPEPVDEDAIEATYRNGVLEVRLPAIGDEDGSGHIIEIGE